MIEKHCIIIDDEDQSIQISKLTLLLRSDGVSLTHIQINPNDFIIEDHSKEDITYDLDKLFLAIKKEIHSGAVLIACDNNLGNEIKGYKLLYQIRTDLKFRHDLILYSGALESLISEISQNSEKSHTDIKKLVEAKISKFLRRTNYPDEIKHVLINQTFDCKNEILNWLNAFQEFTFANGHPEFKNKKLSEIASAIESDTNLGIRFQKIFIEQGIAIMTKLNPFTK